MPLCFDYIVNLRPLLLIYPPIAFRPARYLFTHSPTAENKGLCGDHRIDRLLSRAVAIVR